MSRTALLSIRGLLNWDPDLLDALMLPDGIDADTVKANIIMECSELEVWLPDPDTFRQALRYWSRARMEIWSHLNDTLHYDYNPIWNKDGTITENRTLLSKDNEERDLASSADSSAENKVAAFNAAAYQNSDQNTSMASGTDTGTIDRTRDDTENVTRREQGNIGITSTQQLIKEEREIAEFDIYSYIVRDFKERFCVCVY